MTSDRLIAISPIAPRRCCAAQSRLVQLRTACQVGLKRNTADVAEKGSISIKWLDGTFPDSPKGPVDRNMWITAREERNLIEMAVSGRSLPLDAKFGNPQGVCLVRDDGPLVVVAVATDNAHICTILVNNNIFTPARHGLHVPVIMRNVESLVVIDTEKVISSRLEFNGNELFYFHDHGVAIIDIRWAKNLSLKHLSNLSALVSMRPSLCRHVVLSRSIIVGEVLLNNFSRGPEIIFCFDSVLVSRHKHVTYRLVW